MQELSMVPVPTDEEAVAIAAAVQAMWPQPVVAADAAVPGRDTAWKFSGRWWSRPLPNRRDRPFYR
ncbi:MAG TPA: hypothetical protein PLV68_05380 [Ilumatobacteraceae bacterium]|nr:hypothetical protein [Ilumatobacteraceae bacterium]